MALSQIQILGGRPTDAIGQILGGGSNVLQNVLASAVDSGRRMADNQVRQEDSFINERRDLRLLGERRGNELQRRYEATRAFDESVTRDRRNFAESIFQDRRDFDRSSLVQDRAFGINMAELGLRGAELGLRSEEQKSRMQFEQEDQAMRRAEFNLRKTGLERELDRGIERDATRIFRQRQLGSLLGGDASPAPTTTAPPTDWYNSVLGFPQSTGTPEAPRTPAQSIPASRLDSMSLVDVELAIREDEDLNKENGVTFSPYTSQLLQRRSDLLQQQKARTYGKGNSVLDLEGSSTNPSFYAPR